MVRKKRIGWIFVFAFFLLACISPEKALAENNIESIHIEANIQEDGSVIIRDHRIFYAEEGTEHYISLGNLGDSELLAFTVYDEDNKPLENIGKWNINASFSKKAGKYGINYAGSEIELCFGLGEYGRREFTIEYSISNFISNLSDDHQRFYWQFINSNMDPIDYIEIEVKSDIPYEFSYPETRFWAFGHEGGTTEITRDSLIMKSGDYFYQSDYVVLLGIFEGAPFATSHQSSETSEKLIEKAMGGASLDGYYYDDYIEDNIPNYEEVEDRFFSHAPKRNLILFFIKMPFYILFSISGMFIPMILIVIIVVFIAKNTLFNEEKFTPSSTEGYYREIPYDGDFINTQYFTGSTVADWVSAYILKWVSEGRLVDEVDEVGLIFKKDKLSLKIVTSTRPKSELERELWDMVVKAAGKDYILSEKEFNRYVSRNISKFNEWTGSIKENSKEYMIKEGYLEESTEKFLNLFTQRKLAITEKGQELGDNILKFENYLKDFSLIEERSVSHVALWQELMVWAAYMGIAEEVYEQLKIVNPQIEYQMPYNAQTIIMTHHFARAIASTQSSANSSSSSSSFGGGGGSSFGGGGGGSSGGGSGGGTR